MIQVCKDIALRIFAKISFASTRGFKRHGEIFFDRFLFFFMFFFFHRISSKRDAI